MPYKLDNKGCSEGKYGVINTETGEQKGCSDTREMASAHLRALYANEKKEFDVNDEQSFVDKTMDFIYGIYSNLKDKFSPEVKEVIQEENKSNSYVFMIWKDTTGKYRWLGINSNNYKDKDEDIISAASHNRFVDRVDNGIDAYPVLKHWHIPNSEWGQADWIAFDNDNGIAMVSGYVLPGHEIEAEKAMKSKIELGMSHGMPGSSIKRDKNDSRVIIEHTSVEVSDLPRIWAANEFTAFSILNDQSKEVSEMTIPDNKKQYLRDMGLSDEQIAEIESKNKSIADSAGDIESKEAEVKEEVQELKTEEAVAVEVVETSVETPIPQIEEKKEADTLTAEAVASIIAEAMKPFIVELNTLKEKMEKPVEEKNEDKVETQKEVDLTPTLSVGALIAQKLSAVGSKETFVAKNSVLGKSSPAQENEQDQSTPMMGRVIANILGKKQEVSNGN
jgi:hypothetical protein